MHEASITLRKVSAADAPLLRGWRNDPVARRASRNTREVSPHEHEAWLKQILASTDHVIRIALAVALPVGVVRAARRNAGWELSWTIAPEARGRGLGSKALNALVALVQGDLVAVVHRNNIASQRIAAAAGIALSGETSDPNFMAGRAKSSGEFCQGTRTTV